MDYYVDTTSFTVNPVNWAHVAPFEPERRTRARSPQETRTVVAGVTDFFSVTDGPTAPTANPSRRPAVERPSAVTEVPSHSPAKNAAKSASAEPDEVDRIAKQRVRLMAAKYASGKESTETLARLEILNRRLLERAPRVSIEQVQALEDATALVARARISREERMRRLGIEG